MRVAIVGQGQLARMLALAGWPMGLSFSFLADNGSDTRCVDGLGQVVELPPGPLDAAALYAALGQPDVITVEKEQLDTGLLRSLSAFCRVAPGPDAVAVCQDRLREKQTLVDLALPTSPFVPVQCRDDLAPAAAQLGYPLVIKSTREGYDGKNQWRIRSDAELAAFADSYDGHACIAEQWVSFDRELSLVAARGTDGTVAFYPIAENTHGHGILLHSIAPAALDHSLQQAMQQAMATLLESLDYIGVLAMECFQVGEQFLINELAPRVHNSGHWTQLGTPCCQFSNHLRAITGLPLGATDAVQPTAMVNIIGRGIDDIKPALLGQADQLHWYNKTVRAGRKQGHVNLVAADPAVLQRRLAGVQALLDDDHSDSAKAG